MKLMKLPNGTILPVDDNGGIETVVNVYIGDFIENDLGGLNDIVSEKATGTPLLCDLSWKVVGHHGDVLALKVRGGISMLIDNGDAVEVDFETLPLRMFRIRVTRIGYGSREVAIKARTREEAIQQADDTAGNHIYDESASEYEFDVWGEQCA